MCFPILLPTLLSSSLAVIVISHLSHSSCHITLTHTHTHIPTVQALTMQRHFTPAESPSHGQLDSHVLAIKDTHLFPFVTPSLEKIVNRDNHFTALIGLDFIPGPPTKYTNCVVIGSGPANDTVVHAPASGPL